VVVVELPTANYTTAVKTLLRLEELAQFLLCLGLLIVGWAPWWVYILMLIGPDIGMLGYLINARVGAVTYNILHHKGVPILIIVLTSGALHERFISYMLSMTEFDIPWPLVAAVILYGHASLDRIFGYGLKFGDSFHHTHLGWIGGKEVASGKAEVGEK